MSPRVPQLALLITWLAAGCSPAGSAPTAFTSRPGWWGFDALALEWAPPAEGDFTGYELEWRVGSAAPRRIASFDQGVTSTVLDLGEDSPDGTILELRLRALPDPSGDRVATTTIWRGTRPPQITCEGPATPCAVGPGGFTLRVRNRSQTATGLQLARSKVLAGGGYPMPGPVFALDPSATTFTDPLTDDWSEEARYTYALTAVGPAGPSLPASLSTAPLPVLAPMAPAVAAAPAGLEVTFEAPSERATCYEVTRRDAPGLYGWVVAACLPPPGPGLRAAFVDTAASPTGFHLYEVRAVGPATTSSPASAAWIPAATAGFAIRASSILPATSALRTSRGDYLTATALSQVTLYGPGPSGPVARVIPTSLYGGGAVPRDLPLVETPDGSLSALALEWSPWQVDCGVLFAGFDGTAWTTELLARTPSRAYPDLALGRDGLLRAAWTDRSVRVATRRGGAWSMQTAPGAPSQNYSARLAVAGDAEGVTHVVFDGSDGAVVHAFEKDGAWQSESAPPMADNGYGGLRLVPGPGLLRLVALPRNGGPVAVAERSDAGWGAPSLLSPSLGTYETAALGASGDGATLAVASSAALWVLGPEGTRTALRAPTGLRVVAAGVDAGGKAWILEALQPSSSSTQSFALLYEEL